MSRFILAGSEPFYKPETGGWYNLISSVSSIWLRMNDNYSYVIAHSCFSVCAEILLIIPLELMEGFCCLALL
jgi:hypothetical protein